MGNRNAIQGVNANFFGSCEASRRTLTIKVAISCDGFSCSVSGGPAPKEIFCAGKHIEVCIVPDMLVSQSNQKVLDFDSFVTLSAHLRWLMAALLPQS